MLEEKSGKEAIENSPQNFSFKNRKPAYLAAALILIVLLIIYLLNVYRNRHENKSPLPPKTMTKPVQE